MREGVLWALSLALSLALGLVVVRWLEPGLLGVPPDLQVVQVDQRVAPFYEPLFPEVQPKEVLLKDPYVSVRLRPLLPRSAQLGPTDLLGFRNLAVPDTADVVAIGDSQTHGTGARFEHTWPRLLEHALAAQRASVYRMAVGGWGAVQYLDMSRKAEAFSPRVLIVAFYAGNDPRESFRMAYNVEHWHFLRPDPRLAPDALPPIPRREEKFVAHLSDGRSMTFTPALRLGSNVDAPAVRAGWQIMADVAGRIVRRAREHGNAVVFAMIPTKERVYAGALRRGGARLSQDYEALLRGEARYEAELVAKIRALGAPVVELAPALERAVIAGERPYRDRADGHPNGSGHAVIARELAAAVAPLLARPADAGR